MLLADRRVCTQQVGHCLVTPEQDVRAPAQVNGLGGEGQLGCVVLQLRMQ